ncbi:MAG: 3D domain-containing protein [bacterium]
MVFETGGTVRSYFTSAKTVGGFLMERGIEYAASDSINPPPRAKLTPGVAVSYTKAVRVLISDAGQPATCIMSTSQTVCDLLDETGIGIGPLDRITPSPDSPIRENLEVRITRVKIVDITSEREVKPGVIFKADPEMPRGRVDEINPGSPGVIEDITRVYFKNGQETVRHSLGSRTIVEPVGCVLKIGTRALPGLASRGGQAHRVISMIATAYDPGHASCAPYDDGYTATGRKATKGVCAVDPSVIPLGTQLWIEGYGYAIAADTGGDIKGNRIDVCFDSRDEAIKWGRRTVLVYLPD